jgi:hypothetical protein
MIYQKKYTLIRHQYTEKTDEFLLVYQNIATGQYHIKNAKDVFSNKNLLNNFNSNDRLCISYVVKNFNI